MKDSMKLLLWIVSASTTLSNVRVAAYSQSSSSSSSPSSKSNHRTKTSSPLYVSTALPAMQSPSQRRRQPVMDFNNDNNEKNPRISNGDNKQRRARRKYKRKRSIPDTEQHLFKVKEQWKKDYERIVNSAAAEGAEAPSFWSFECLFPEPILDEASVKRDLYGARDRDAATSTKRNKVPLPLAFTTGIASNNKNPVQPRSSAAYMNPVTTATSTPSTTTTTSPAIPEPQSQEFSNSTALASIYSAATATLDAPTDAAETATPVTKIDRDLTRMVEDRMFGYRRTSTGDFQYDTSLMGDGAIQFRDGVRLGNPLKVNADRLNYLAKKELQHGRVEEAQEMYEQAIVIDPHDGRAYLGLSRCAERRRDFALARECLRAGIIHSSTPVGSDGLKDRGPNPFLLQALGCLEEKMGHLSKAETLYISAARSRPWHAAAWVALSQLRTRKLGQSADAGRVLFQIAEKELATAGKTQSSHVYTAWASLENQKAGDVRRARELYKSALKIDPRCSAAFLQLGVMEADNGNWDEAQECFDSVLKFDQRNSRVLQAYAIMETKRPNGDSRKAIGLFERALKANPRDAGVLQAYALYVARLGDVPSARTLLTRASEVNKRHAPVWQAWGVLEMNEGNHEQARGIFQQGIWACAQIAGGQSGGYSCARLWQAWGLLEAKEGDYAAARRCFSRAIDADSRNVATVTAWALMEEDLGNVKDARMIFERALKQFAAGSESKKGLWTTYESMEKRLGNLQDAQRVYQRSMRETLTKADAKSGGEKATPASSQEPSQIPTKTATPDVQSEVEVVRWDAEVSSMRGEVWMNDRSIESKVPKRRRTQKLDSQNSSR